MKKTKTIMAILLSVIMIAGVLTGCNSKAPVSTKDNNSDNQTTDSSSGKGDQKEEPSAKGVTIQFWNAFTGSDGDVLREIVNRFNNENEDGIKIEMDIMPGATLAEKLAPAITTGTAPAMILAGNMDVVQYSKTGSILPMSDFFDVTKADKSDFVAASLESLQYDGEQMMIPMQWFTQYLYYNKDLFEAAGLNSEIPPVTWEEVREFAKKITNPDKNVFGVGLPVGGAVPWFGSLFLSNGGEILDVANKKSLLDNEANFKSLQFVQEIVNSGYSPKGSTGADLDNLMMADQLGMVVNGPWMVNGLKENEINFGVAPLPAGTKSTVGIAEVTGFAITKGTSEEEKAAAYKFIEFWNTTDTCKEWSIRNGFPPYLKSVAEDSEVQADPIVSVFSAVKDYGQSFGTGLASAATINNDALFPMIENVIAGNDCQDELTKASAKIDELLATE
ncbi:MAG: ABC transporter substrate-binding protein [Anaerolineaceae bacterium]|nr:MAG: ABC transporter substrate-binding protein [Anaerolineaceae bacterium]